MLVALQQVIRIYHLMHLELTEAREEKHLSPPGDCNNTVDLHVLASRHE